jgi:hypothetical protein
MAEEMNVDMLAPDELVFPGIGAPAGFTAARASLPTGAAAVGDGLPTGVGVAAGDALGMPVLHKGLL